MSGAPDLCVGYGLTIATHILIPGAMRATGDEAADLYIEYGAPPPWTERLAWGPYRVADADLFDFTMPGVATFTCRDRRRIIITPHGCTDEAAIAAMLIATALPALLWARGEIVLHAAAVAMPGASAGMLFAGASGSGKTRRLLRASEAGGRAIADDSVRLRLVDNSVLASGLPGGAFGRGDRDGNGGDARTFRAFPRDRQLREFPVKTVYLLDAGETQNAPDPRLAALTALLRHRHRPRIAQVLRTEPELLQPLARIAAALEIEPIRS